MYCKRKQDVGSSRRPTPSRPTAWDGIEMPDR
jgi:hypothetical protein